MRSALRQLCRHGIEALRPQKVNDKWRSPRISRRVAADLRKAAIRNGTYGKFDTETGIGWDPAWDEPKRTKQERIEFALNIDNATNSDDVGEGTDMVVDNLLFNPSNKGLIKNIRPPKGHKRERTRESRAQKIEKLLESADDKIEEYRLEREKRKPKTGIEEEYKRMTKGSKW